MTAAGVAEVSGLTTLAPNLASLPKGQALYIPMQCSCDQNYVTSQMQVPYILQERDTLSWLAAAIYGALTTWQAIETWNSKPDARLLVVGETIVVPVFCACPTAEQVAKGTNFLVTTSFYANESLDFTSGIFGITTEELSAANELAVNATLNNFRTLLVPLVTLPAIATLKFPQGPTIVSPSNYSQRRTVGIIAGISAGVIAVMLVAGFIIQWYRRRTSSKEQDKLSCNFRLVDQNLVLRIFAFQELRKATKNFSTSEILGSGGFGAVYKGTLPSGELVAVKRIRMESKHGKESFRAEVTSLSHIRHRNLVQLRGWCHEEEQLFLVCDFMCNGSLYEWLFRFSDCREKQHGKGILPNFGDAEASLSLKLRHSILSGVASALSHLHEECAQCVLHRDIKSSNVLLDGNLNAYLGDFGPGCLVDHQKMAKTTMMAGTLGYMAPEMPHTGKATKETDVFSFGVLMLEMMCGTRPLDVIAIERGDGVLVDRVWRAHEGGNILQVSDRDQVHFLLQM